MQIALHLCCSKASYHVAGLKLNFQEIILNILPLAFSRLYFSIFGLVYPVLQERIKTSSMLGVGARGTRVEFFGANEDP